MRKCANCIVPIPVHPIHRHILIVTYIHYNIKFCLGFLDKRFNIAKFLSICQNPESVSLSKSEFLSCLWCCKLFFVFWLYQSWFHFIRASCIHKQTVFKLPFSSCHFLCFIGTTPWPTNGYLPGNRNLLQLVVGSIFNKFWLSDFKDGGLPCSLQKLSALGFIITTVLDNVVCRFVKHGILPHTTFGIIASCTLQLCLKIYFWK